MDQCVVPIGVGVHLSPCIAQTVNSRTDPDQSLKNKVASVQALL